MLILLVEADPRIGQPTADWLRAEGHRVEWLTTGLAARLQWPRLLPDLVLLAWHLQDHHGIDLCGEIRAKSAVPIVVLGSDRDMDTCVAALEAGADDYLVPPINRRELVARIRAIGRRTPGADDSEVLRIGDLAVYPAQFRVMLGDEELRLRPQEYRLLLILIREPGMLFSTERLMQLAWEKQAGNRSVGVHIAWLRARLSGSNVRIENVRGIGFRLVNAGDDTVPAPPAP
jgi:DNA-binding response OmpR family regulator